MPRAQTAIEAIDREIAEFEARRERARARDVKFQERLDEIVTIRRQNLALIEDYTERMSRLANARDELSHRTALDLDSPTGN